MIAALVGLASVGAWDYKENGRDWPRTAPGCRGLNQSPIDLKSDYGAYTYYDASAELHRQTCTANTVGGGVSWAQSPLSDPGAKRLSYGATGSCVTRSRLAQEKFGTEADSWASESTEYHHQSEHTIDGKRFDLELTMYSSFATDHGAGGGAGEFDRFAQSILFSVDDYTAKLSADEQNILDTYWDLQ